MSVVVCWSAKGGAGTTVVAAALALGVPGRVLVDLPGELPATLGLSDPAGQGLAEWFASDAPAAAIVDLAVPVDGAALLVAPGASVIDDDAPRWEELARWMAADRRTFVIDAGLGPPPSALTPARHEAGTVRDLLVTRTCYLALRRACALTTRPSGVIVVSEPRRALQRSEVARSLGAPVVATVALDPAVARAVDAGLLASGLPGSLRRALRSLRSQP
jgi:hypothetical protein